MSQRTASHLRVCLLAPGVYAWGSRSGAGRAARTLGRELVKRGVRVSAVVPRRRGQRELEQIDGITVRGYPPESPWHAAALCRECDADVYHSLDPSLPTALAAAVAGHRRHVVTIRAPRDWMAELQSPGRSRLAAEFVLTENPLTWLAVHRADSVCCASEDLIPVVGAKYRVRNPVFLPSPVVVPHRVQKGSTATVCFLGGWLRHHRPELFFELARSFPRVTFVAVGKSRDRLYDASLRREYGTLPNLHMTGPIDPFRSDALANVLSESWVLVSTGARLGLPYAVVEGAAHRCAILSDTDPDRFASRFGHHAADGDLAAGLTALLSNDAWRERGERGHEFVREVFEMSRAMGKHLETYGEAVKGDQEAGIRDPRTTT